MAPEDQADEIDENTYTPPLVDEETPKESILPQLPQVSMFLNAHKIDKNSFSKSPLASRVPGF